MENAWVQSRYEYDILSQYTTSLKNAFVDSFACFLASYFAFIISEKSPLKKNGVKPSEKLVKRSEMIQLL